MSGEGWAWGLAEEDLKHVDVEIALIPWDQLDELRSRAAVHQQPEPPCRDGRGLAAGRALRDGWEDGADDRVAAGRRFRGDPPDPSRTGRDPRHHELGSWTVP